MAMTVAEARSEIASLYEKADLIEKKYPEGEITNNEDLAEVKRILGEIDGLEEKLTGLETAEARRNRILAGVERFNTPARGQPHPNPEVQRILEGKAVDPGTQFLNAREYRELRGNGAFNSHLNRVEFSVNLKDGTSLIDWHEKMQRKDTLLNSSATSGGAFVQNDRQPGFVGHLTRDIVVMDLIPRVSTESDTVEYVKESVSTWTTTATFTAEATGSALTGTHGRKTETTMAFEVATAAVRTLAHWLPVTNRMLADAPAIRGIINSRLLLGLALVLESQVVTGNGSGENLTGILSTSGLQTQGKGTDNELDAIFKARTKVRVTGRGRPNAVMLHPNDWEAIRLTRENSATATLGNYLMGPPSQVGAVTVWGIPVVESDVITENTGMVGDFNMGCTLFDREQSAIRVGTVNDQFIRNMQTILAELRCAFVVWRPTMFCQVTGI